MPASLSDSNVSGKMEKVSNHCPLLALLGGVNAPLARVAIPQELLVPCMFVASHLIVLQAKEETAKSGERNPVPSAAESRAKEQESEEV